MGDAVTLGEIWQDIIASAGGTSTDSTLAGLMKDFAQAMVMLVAGSNIVVNVRAYGAKGDGVTDDSTAVLAAIQAAYDAGGGIVWFPPSGSTYLINSALALPNDGQSHLPRQNPIRLTGAVPTANGYLEDIVPLVSGSVLDLRYNGGGSAVAKIDTRGAGFLEIDHLTLLSGGSDNYPFFQTTNTTVHIHHNAVLGNRANSGTSCEQDAFRLGGNGATSQDLNSNSYFQGYGSRLHDNFYDQIRRCIIFGAEANGVFVDNETVSKTCGSSTNPDGPFYFDAAGAGGGVSGVTIVGTVIEVTNYTYAFVLAGTVIGLTLVGPGIYDESDTTLGAAYCASAAVHNLCLNPFYDAGPGGLPVGFWTGPGGFANSLVSAGSIYDLPVFSYGLIVNNESGNGLHATLIQTGPGGVIQSADAANPAGGNMTIDTGTGGANLDLHAAAIRFFDAADHQIGEFDPYGAFHVSQAEATPPGGDANHAVLFGSVPALGIYFGSGAPSITAPKGSLYLRTDGTSTTSRMYVNTNGSTTWTAVTTVA